ncbi:hypothetical protein RS030_6923 [Cryptosporidium xiaoi]|uniref:Phospholipid-transporting ATPase n=1 Tax=Cryptosporidium xiaoi TaxID=659607 RepID=A0AAV9XXI2_9CRYT
MRLHLKINFSGNFIRTSRYTAFNFIPKYLFEQFCRPVNFYFLVIAILQVLPSVSSTNGIPTLAFPLVFVLFVGAVKDGWEDLNRHRNDKAENERDVITISRFPFINYIHGRLLSCDLEDADKSKNKMPSLKHIIPIKAELGGAEVDQNGFLEIEGTVKSTSRDLKVGDLVLIRNHETIPADIVLLSSSSEVGEVFVDTSSLDGESNLKRKFSNKESIRVLGTQIQDVVRRSRYLEGLIECSPPGKDLHHFDGTAIIRLPPISEGHITQGNTTISQFPINIDNIVLRGCILRSTEWAIGCIVYAGHESKIQMNSLKPKKKMSNVDAFTNKMVMFVMILLFGLCITGSTFTYYFMLNGMFSKLAYLGVSDTNEISFRATGQAIPMSFVPVVRFCTWLVLLANIIPIALIVSMKIVKAFQGYFISKDRYMFDPEKKIFAVVRNSDLNEDLGQVRYLFTDKTGTLTRNIMEFKSFAVSGVQYGLKENYSGDVFKIETPQVNIQDEDLFTELKSDSEQKLKIAKLLLSISLNNTIVVENQNEVYKNLKTVESINFHSVIDETKGGLGGKNSISTTKPKPVYSAQFPDEAALCYGAQHLGVVLMCSDPTSKHLILEAFGVLLDVEILATIPFTSDRKRSTVIVKINKYNVKKLDKGDEEVEGMFTENHKNQRISELFRERIVVFSKGADSVMPQLLRKEGMEEYKTDLEIGNKMANHALRVLCIAEKELCKEEFNDWYEKYQKAACSVEGREKALAEVAELIEKDLSLLGVTGVEDRLQDQVQETIMCLREAGIRIWMLTGDKVGTAREIAASAGLLGSDSDILEISEETCKNKMELKKRLFSICKALNIKFESDERKVDRIPLKIIRKKKEENRESRNTSIIIDGAMLGEIFSGSLGNTEAEGENDLEMKKFNEMISNVHSIEKLFVQICCDCHTVIFARFAPSQKGNIVRIVRKHMNEITLAIGDGANDCNMIQTANVGVGVRGLEGNQAFLTADYGITAFKDLKALLLIHGRLSYRRICKLALYMFYKNFTVGIPVFIYGYFTLWSGTRLYFDYWYQVYNVILSSVPIIVVSVFDFDVTKSESFSNPKLYRYGPENKFLNVKVCFTYLLNSLWHIFIVFTLPYILFSVNSTNAFGSNQSVVGATIYYLIILVVNIKVLLMADHIHYLLGFSVAFSLFSWICTLFVCTSSFSIGSDVYSLWIPLYNNILLWISLISGLSIALWPDYFLKVVSNELEKVKNK